MIVIIFSVSSVSAQRAAISVDALKWATLTPNIEVEVLLSSRLTLGVEATVNPFEEVIPSLITKQVSLSPELRYWFKRPLYSHFVGVNLLGSIYDYKLLGEESSGRVAAVGVVYGYSLYLSPRWALTPAVGVGVGSFRSCDVVSGVSGPYVSQIKPTLTKLGVTLSYIID